MEKLSIFNNLLLVLFALGVTLCAGNLGFLILNAIGGMGTEEDENRKIFFPFYSLGVGFAAISMMMYGLSVFGAINKCTIWGTLIFQAALLFPNKRLRHFFSYPYRRFFTPPAAFFAVFFISGLIISSTPTLETDSATTYLNAAKLFLQHHRVIDVGNAVGDMAKNIFMLIAYGLGLESSLLSQTILFIISFSGILCCFLFISQKVNAIFAGLVMIIFMAMRHQVDIVIGTVKVDGTGFTYSVLALCSIVHFFENGKSPRRVYACMNGIFVGFLIGLSYLYLPAFAIYLFFLAAFLHRAEMDFKNKLALLGSWLICAILVASPGYLYNIAEFANPLYPYYGNIFGRGLGGNIGDKSFIFSYINEVKWNLSSRNIGSFLMLPLILFSNPTLLQSGKEYLFAAMWVLASAAMLIAGSIALYEGRGFKEKYFKSDDFSIFVIVLAGYIYFYVFWATVQFNLRYFAIGFPFLLLLSAFLFRFVFGYFNLQRLRKYSPLFLLCFGGIVIFSFMPFLDKMKTACSSIVKGKTVDSIVGERFRYVTKNGRMSDFGRAIVTLKERLVGGDKVLSFITGNYYFGRDAVVFSGNGAITLPSRFGISKPLYEFDGYEEFEKALRENGFTYMVVNPNFLYLSKDEENVIMSYMENRQADITVDGTLIYRLNQKALT